MAKMRRWLVSVSAVLVAAASVTAVVPAPRAWAGDAPIGHIGDTLRVDNGTFIADVTVSGVAPCDPPPGFGYTREGTYKGFPGSTVERADVTIRAIRVPNPYIMATIFSFNGVTPNADAYKPRASDAPDALDNVIVNAPDGAIVRGEVYWDAYRDPVSTVVLLDKKTGYHLAQWNL
ncbi:hypothetical protein A5644_22060 [Mycobacterium intracellulare subsp. yongonense]|nr:hypothetical protein A5644_22060 [Mycobacterium intracellulare subsp. yongonense]PBA56446.1 hypothetical protein CKJ57_18255 [Mycobacterium intracellulare subsp. chimaera]